MLGRKSSTVQQHTVVASLLGLVALAVWTFGVFRMGAAQAGPAEIDLRTGLLTTNRSSLRLCINSKVPAVSDAALQAVVRLALAKVATHPGFASVGFKASTMQVDIECPGPMRIAEPGFVPRAGFSDHGNIVVDQPTQYRTYVFVVPPTQMTPLLSYPFQRVPQEIYCPPASRSTCAAVSTAVYLTPDDVHDIAKVTRELAGALGLDPDELPA